MSKVLSILILHFIHLHLLGERILQLLLFIRLTLEAHIFKICNKKFNENSKIPKKCVN